jgi:hypothetical protein
VDEEKIIQARIDVAVLQSESRGNDKALLLVADSLKSQIGTAVMFIKALAALMFLLLGAMTLLLGIAGLIWKGH